MRRVAFFAAAGGVVWLAAVAAPAEIYKCKGPDGRTLYTSDQSQCPGAEKHEPKGTVHTVDPVRPPDRSRGADPLTGAPPRASGVRFDVEAAHAAAWRRKKAEAQSEIARLDERVPELEKSVTWCNRGGDLYVQDDLGLRRTIPCDRARDDLARAEAELARLREYLATGLEEECRKAGCLPGWIRD